MAELQHTPFPWYVHPEALTDGDIVSIEAMTPDRKMITREVCTVMIDGDTEDERAEDVGNALLISEVPAMYAIVRGVMAGDSITNLRYHARNILDRLHAGQEVVKEVPNADG